MTFPRALGGMKSLRRLDLCRCNLRAIPAFVRELGSLEILGLEGNRKLQIDASDVDFLLEGCPRLRDVSFAFGASWTPTSRSQIQSLASKLQARIPDARVCWY